MTAARSPIPGGTVSRVRGKYQAPGLTWLTRGVLVLSLVGGLLGGPAGRAVATTAVVAIVATPLLRVVWLILRWAHERDRRFALLGFGLLVVVAFGGVLAALGVGA